MPASRTKYGASRVGAPTHSDGSNLQSVKLNHSPTVLSTPDSHQSWRGNLYNWIPMAVVPVPALSKGSALIEIRTISPKEIVTIAK